MQKRGEAVRELKDLLGQLKGRTVNMVSFRENGMCIVFGRAGSRFYKALGVHDVWRYECNGQAVLGSWDLPFPDEGSVQKLDLAASKTKLLVGAKVLDLQLSNITYDICVKFTGNQYIKTFTASRKHNTWTVYD